MAKTAPHLSGPRGLGPAGLGRPLPGPGVVVGGGIAGVLCPVEEDRLGGFMGAGEHIKGGFQAELVADLEGDWAADQVDPVDDGVVGPVGA